ncbi:MAG: hypothetical protein QOG87_4071 [Actinomycetota bacterium]
MNGAVGGANIALGLGYLLLGTIVAIELVRQWREPGVWQFGAALTAIAFTCGPHHLTHGVHVGFEHEVAGRLDLVTTLVGIPPAAVFVWLRLEALVGKRGDRLIAGTPGWIQALPVAAGAYFAIVLTVGFGMMRRSPGLSLDGLLSLASAGLFAGVALVFARTQLRNREALGGWSLSGLGLLGLFGTCAVMHTAVAMEATSQVRSLDIHLVTVDVMGVLAALWFLAVVRAMTRGARREWDAVGNAATAGG